MRLTNVDLPNAQETLWNCADIHLNHVTAKGDYFGMNSANITIDDFTLAGNYAFDGAKNMEIRNAKLISKDAFWNCENITVYDSLIIGEYLGWNSKNINLSTAPSKAIRECATWTVKDWTIDSITVTGHSSTKRMENLL
ncbi:DUF3737 family protein [Paenibacillus polymyxa]|uniref:DUF3737 family protein n=1 Tax=Paenibacillus polymyxa TaxID=1406 RepID=A0AAE9Q135_PAEPO|nr:DUF3737 family protein [Paenibacillus polymyxa]